MFIASALLAALLIDRLVGEPKALHPLVGFGVIAAKLEQFMNSAPDRNKRTRLLGAIAWLCMVLPLPLLLVWLVPALSEIYRFLISVAVFYFTLGWRSLLEHGRMIGDAVSEGGLAAGREKVAYIVSRDTADMDEAEIARATLESVLENGSDAIYAPIFWFCVAGPYAALLYRFANTLDAMWGYKKPQYIFFGWASARIDDALNYIPARLTALSYALMGECKSALRCWRVQAHNCVSPNGGPVMCSGAGAIGVQLGVGASYHGQWREKPVMGCGKEAEVKDIERGLGLINRTLLLWVLTIVSLCVLFTATTGTCFQC